jgi:hypothetical protein
MTGLLRPPSSFSFWTLGVGAGLPLPLHMELLRVGSRSCATTAGGGGAPPLQNAT